MLRKEKRKKKISKRRTLGGARERERERERPERETRERERMDLQKRLLSKQWKDRIAAYEELGELPLKDDTVVARYAPYLKRIVADTANPRSQEAALSALVSFLSQLSQKEPARLVSTPKQKGRRANTAGSPLLFLPSYLSVIRLLWMSFVAAAAAAVLALLLLLLVW